MFNWILRVIGGAAGIVDETIRRWVGGLISGVFGFIHAVNWLVGGAWDLMYDAGAWLADNMAGFVREVFHAMWWLLHIAIPDVVRWANHLIHTVVVYAREIYHWAAREFDRLRHDIARWLDDFRHWVLVEIFDPLKRLFDTAWHWITHEGYILWYYLTHIAKLVDLFWLALLAKIEREAWIAGRLLGRFFASLILHNLRTFVVLLEDILDSVL